MLYNSNTVLSFSDSRILNLHKLSKMSSGWDFRHRQQNSVPFRIEFLNIVISKNNCKQVGIILDGIIGSNDPEVLVGQVSDLSSTKETVLLLGLLFLQTDLSFQLGIMDDSVQC